MGSANSASLRDKFDGYKADIASLRKEGKITKEVDVVFSGLCRLLGILIAILFEKGDEKRPARIPASLHRRPARMRLGRPPKKNRNTNAAEKSMTGENFETVTVEEISTVEVCDSCGTDLSDIEPSAREQRVQFDIKYTVKKLKVVGEIKDCPECRARTKGGFPENMPGPLQYGDGIKALVINLLVAQMLSLRRYTELVHAITGIKLSEATCLSYIQRLHDALEPWKVAAKEHLLTRPALHVDETGFRVGEKNQWLHAITDGSVVLKYLHRKRGKETIRSFSIIPVYSGVLIHDRWAPYFAYNLCRHQVCGSQLLRDLAFVVDSNNYRWARLMKTLLCEI